MKTLSLLVAVLAACGGSKSATPVSGKADSNSIEALDTVLAQLESLRPFVVTKDDDTDCAAYTPAATEIVIRLGLSTPDAKAARAASPEPVTQWQKVHTSELENLVVEVATPVRSATGCAAMEKDEVWAKVSSALVAIAEPAQPPAPVIERRVLLDSMLAAAAAVSSPDDCKKIIEAEMAKHPTLEANMKAMTPLEKFIDDKVWEEADEKRAEAHTNFPKLKQHCGM